MKESKLRKLIREEAKNLLTESASREFYQEVVDQLRRDYPFFGPYKLEDGNRIVFYADNGSGGRSMYYVTIADIGPSEEVDLAIRNSSGTVVDAVGDVNPITVPKVIKNLLLP